MKDEDESVGRRRTRSSNKPVPDAAPSPPKREKKTPAPKPEKKGRVLVWLFGVNWILV